MNVIFKALNDAIRREILEILRIHDASAGEIADRFNISKPSISHHLDILKQAKLVSSKKKGQFIIYAINMEAIEEAINWLLIFKSESPAEKPRIRLQLNTLE
jgi:ArsR family transcriptional regulator, arsenate/arsenite/antimonite-responsive transcriptional repressor